MVLHASSPGAGSGGMIRVRIRSLLLILPLIAPATARADSDGYFCTGRGYIAWETRFDTLPAGHRLHVVRFSRAGGLVRSEPIPLEDFQVHAMSCRETSVELTGWTTRYTVDLLNPAQPVVTARAGAPGSADEPQRNLGHWSREGVTDLESDGAADEFQLVISRVSRRVTGGIEHYTVTQIIRRDLRPGVPRILEAIKVFEGVLRETVN